VIKRGNTYPKNGSWQVNSSISLKNKKGNGTSIFFYEGVAWGERQASRGPEEERFGSRMEREGKNDWEWEWDSFLEAFQRVSLKIQ
jgi:hypothetical protein